MRLLFMTSMPTLFARNVCACTAHSVVNVDQCKVITKVCIYTTVE